MADGALIGKEQVQEVAGELMLSFAATEKIVQFVEEEGNARQPSDVIAMAATLVTTVLTIKPSQLCPLTTCRTT